LFKGLHGAAKLTGFRTWFLPACSDLERLSFFRGRFKRFLRLPHIEASTPARSESCSQGRKEQASTSQMCCEAIDGLRDIMASHDRRPVNWLSVLGGAI